jgi:hypothetical protein
LWTSVNRSGRLAAELVLDRSAELLDERRAQVGIDRRARAADPEAERAELLRPVVAAVPVQVGKVVLGDIVAAGIRRRERIGEVVVVAAVERLQDRSALSRHVERPALFFQLSHPN